MVATIEFEKKDALNLVPGSRTYRLREMFWHKTYEKAFLEKTIKVSSEDTVVGYAKDFAYLLEVSDPFIQPDELIVGSCLAAPQNNDKLNLGFYDTHFPPGHHNILKMGLAGIRDYARTELAIENCPDKRAFLHAVIIAYDAACSYVKKYALLATEMAANEINHQQKTDLHRIADVCNELAVAPPSSFHAAQQLVQFTRIFGGNGCIGRIDQWLYPFYINDMDRGILTRDNVLELIECFFVKVNEFPFAYMVEFPDKYRIWPSIVDDGLIRNDNMRNIMLAGQTPEGTDASNELSTLCLRASARLMLPEPKLNVRFFDGTPSNAVCWRKVIMFWPYSTTMLLFLLC